MIKALQEFYTLIEFASWCRQAVTSYHLDPHLARRSCQRAVSCDERSIQRFSKCQISGVISGETVPHLPDARKKHEMWIAGKWKVNEIDESFGAAFS